MTQLNVLPEQLLGASAQVAALTGRLIAANAAHAVATGAVLPPGSDLPSFKVAASLMGHGAAHQAAASMGNEELARSSMGVADSGVSYMIGDADGAAAYVAAAGL